MSPQELRIVFMGTADFGLPSLEILLQNGFPVVAVVTNPDKPAGRGLKLVPPPVKTAATRLGLPLMQPESLKSPQFVSELRQLDADVIVVVAFKILPPDVFMSSRLGSLNLHASLLPKYRGAASIQRAIMEGATETGVTTFLLAQKVDTGSILLQARCPIGPNETAGEVHDRLAAIGAEIVLHSVRMLQMGIAQPTPQADEAATLAPKIHPDDCVIKWHGSAEHIHNLIRGLSPSPGAVTSIGRTRVKIFRSLMERENRISEPGVVLTADRRLVISAGEGAVEILELQQDGKKRMPAEEWLRGYRLQPGDRFGL